MTKPDANALGRQTISEDELAVRRFGDSTRAVVLGVAIASSTSIVACGSTPAESVLASTTIVGEFGGNGAQLHADASHATLDLVCGTVTMTTPLVSDASGQISSTGSRKRTGGAIILVGEEPTPVHVTGRATSADGGTIRLVVTTIPDEPGGPVTAGDTLTVVRDRAATIFLCP